MEKIKYRGTELLPPKSDVVFKAMFGAEENKEILAAFLRDMLDLNIGDYHDLELMNTEILQKHENDKLVRLDVRIKTKESEQLDVEIQVQDKGNIIPRSVLYESKLFSSQLEAGQNYQSLRRAISLIILDFNLFKDNKSGYNKYRLINTVSGEPLTDLIEIVFVELQKVGDIESVQKKDLWTLFLSTESEEVLDLLSEKSTDFKKAIDTLKYVSGDEKVRREYERRREAELDYNSGIDYARQQGLEQGLEQGIEQERMETAKNMKIEGISNEVIARVVGMPIEAVERL